MGGPEDEEARCTGCVDDERGVADRVQEQEEQDREIDCLEMLDCGRQDRAKSMSVLDCLNLVAVAGQQDISTK